MTKDTAKPQPDFHEEFSKQKERFRRLLKEACARTDEKNVHQLRVSTRRLRAAISIARANGADGKVERKTLKRLKKLGKTLGAYREADVLRRDLHSLGIPFAGELPARKLLRKKLKAQKKFTRSLEAVDEHLKTEAPRPFEGIVAALRAKLEALQAQKYVRSEELHALRVEIKKIRYSFEMMGLPTEELRALQSLLGELHDAEVLAQYLRERDERHALSIVEKRQQDRVSAAKKRIQPVLAATRKLLS